MTAADRRLKVVFEQWANLRDRTFVALLYLALIADGDDLPVARLRPRDFATGLGRAAPAGDADVVDLGARRAMHKAARAVIAQLEAAGAISHRPGGGATTDYVLHIRVDSEASSPVDHEAEVGVREPDASRAGGGHVSTSQ